MSNLLQLQERIGYRFSDLSILMTALTHQSYANEHNVESYERLEFLGDAVIELIVSNYIYNHCKLSSGDLTKLRASLVSTTYLFNISNQLKLTDYVLKAKSLSTLSKKNTADLLESLIGAIFVDSGIETATVIVEKLIIIDDNNIASVLQNGVDAKTQLQELFQSKGLSFNYEMIDSFGMDHEKSFVVVLKVEGKQVAQATARSIREAETECARLYLKNL